MSFSSSALDRSILKNNFLDNYGFISMLCSIFFFRDSFYPMLGILVMSSFVVWSHSLSFSLLFTHVHTPHTRRLAQIYFSSLLWYCFSFSFEGPHSSFIRSLPCFLNGLCPSHLLLFPFFSCF